MKIFVPGRICLFGEHSDWAGGYRRVNVEIEKGRALIVGTNQGIHADVRPHPDKLVLRSVLEDGSQVPPIEIPMEREALLKAAQSGGFESYAAGTAYRILTHYRVHGVEIDNYLTDLPVKKGLSSSAAICVLVARAFNRLYDLKLTVRGEMECAYAGEISTPSRCGRLDQGCAYGNRPILMTFDGDLLDVEEIAVPKTLHYLIVDLHAAKDTKKILADLNRCYPFAENETQREVQRYLGPANADLVRRAADALKEGDAETLGRLMDEAQCRFDEALRPASPDQLAAPKLHELLNHPAVRPLVLGGKGVGSQGDGTAQFLLKDETTRDRLVEIIEREFHLSCLGLDVRSARPLRKAVVSIDTLPEGGIQSLAETVERLIDAGLEEIALLVRPEDRPEIERRFRRELSADHPFDDPTKEERLHARKIMELHRHVDLIDHPGPLALPSLLRHVREWVREEPVLFVQRLSPPSGLRRLVEIYERTGKSVVGLRDVPANEIERYVGVVGEWEENDAFLAITELLANPSTKRAEERLSMPDLPENRYLALAEQYVLTPAAFCAFEPYVADPQADAARPFDEFRRREGLLGVRMEPRKNLE